MVAQDVITMITSVGFPCVMCLACAWYIKYTYDKQREEVSALNASHVLEIDKITQALNNNTLALTRLVDLIQNKEE